MYYLLIIYITDIYEDIILMEELDTSYNFGWAS